MIRPSVSVVPRQQLPGCSPNPGSLRVAREERLPEPQKCRRCPHLQPPAFCVPISDFQITSPSSSLGCLLPCSGATRPRRQAEDPSESPRSVCRLSPVACRPSQSLSPVSDTVTVPVPLATKRKRKRNTARQIETGTSGLHGAVRNTCIYLALTPRECIFHLQDAICHRKSA